MADDKTPQPDPGAPENQPAFQLVRCYLKDASLEMPHAPDIFISPPEGQPTVDMKFESQQSKLSVDNGYEVVVRATVTVKAQEQTMFLVEAKQAGIFEMRNIPQEGIAHLQNVLCPAMIYPYLRANIADLITRTGLPPIHLPEVNFEGLYQQRLAQARARAEAQAGAQQGDGSAAHA